MDTTKARHQDILQFNVVFGCGEATHRDAVLFSLTTFGFVSNRVHVVGDVDSAIEKVKDLHAGQHSPVVVLLPSQERDTFSQHKFRSQYFLVCTSDSAIEVTQTVSGGEGTFHCEVPQRLDEAVLRVCSEYFQSWLKAEKDKEDRRKRFHEVAEKKRRARAGGGSQSMAAPSFNRTPPAHSEPAQLPAVQALSSVVGAQYINRSAIVHPEAVQPSAAPALPFVQVPAAQAPFFASPVFEAAQFSSSTISLSSNTAARNLSDAHASAQCVDAWNMPYTGLTSGASESSSMACTSDRGNSVASLALLIPARSPFEDIHIIRRVGRGSFATVYKARWDASPVALKVVRHKDDFDETKALFEGSLTAALAHPNLVQTFKHSIRETVADEHSAKAWEVWIVQDWCGMGTLSQNAASQKLLKRDAWDFIVEVCCEISSAASYLHSRGIIHGDLSGNNVMYALAPGAKKFVSKLCDFGMARVLGDKNSLETQSMGTVSSMPPELFALEGAALTRKVDVYAFGVLLWILCSGDIPFNGLEPASILVMVANGKALEMPLDVPTTIVDVYKKCIARSPEERPSFQMLVHDLLDIMKLDGLPTVAEQK